MCQHSTPNKALPSPLSNRGPLPSVEVNTPPTPLHFLTPGVRRRQHKPARATPAGSALPLRHRAVIPRRANMGTAIL
jgi:hypothetical protein